MNYAEMDRKELVAEAKKAGITKAATTKTEELISLLSGGKIVEEEPTNTVAVEEEIPSGRIIDPEEKKLATAEHNMTQVMCIVTDHQTGITVEEAGVSPVYRMSWGNKLGSVSVTVRLDGRPQYLHIATIRRLREVVNPFVGKDENGKETSKLGDKRFTVTIVDGWTQEQIDAKVKQQAARG